MKKETIKGFVYFEGVKTGLHIESIKEMSFEEQKNCSLNCEKFMKVLQETRR